MSKKMSARREFLSDEIAHTRKQLIARELEEKFCKEYLVKLEGKQELTEQDLNFKNDAESLLRTIDATREYLVERLNFFKRERERETTKKAMKFYNRCPKKISTENLVEHNNA